MTDHADLIAALRIPMNVTLRDGAPELDEYDEQRKAAADALEAVWAEATAAAYGAAGERITQLASAEYEIGNSYEGQLFGHACGRVLVLTPADATAALEARDARVRAEALRDAVNACTNVGQETKPGNASEALIFHLGFTEGRKLCERAISAIHTDASRALPIKEKDDE